MSIRGIVDAEMFGACLLFAGCKAAQTQKFPRDKGCVRSPFEVSVKNTQRSLCNLSDHMSAPNQTGSCIYTKKFFIKNKFIPIVPVSGQQNDRRKKMMQGMFEGGFQEEKRHLLPSLDRHFSAAVKKRGTCV
ncbi:MAG: hypothetical protein HFF60_05595 [Oscillospiraceae bacterium]|nr:hypothetical protein [Oscillospiraceae bacterium]